jgi:hypothetical protein
VPVGTPKEPPRGRRTSRKVALVTATDLAAANGHAAGDGDGSGWRLDAERDPRAIEPLAAAVEADELSRPRGKL